MIFTLEHIKKIWLEQKTQTRRWSARVPTPLLYNRYKIGQLYAVQEGRGKPGLPDMKIRITRKWIESEIPEKTDKTFVAHKFFIPLLQGIPILPSDAQAEGGYDPENYEVEFRKLNPKWDGIDRVGLEFEVVRL